MEPQTGNHSISILGAGSSGLGVGYFARKHNLPFVIYDANPAAGGNAVTYRHDEFLYDSGAHRWHDKDPEMTAEMKGLLGDRLKQIFVPSRIFHRGRFVDFPLSPLNLLASLGPLNFSRAALEVLAARLGRAPADGSFESFALHTYGRTIADRFLLNYSEKLWGASCSNLSPSIAGKRMKGLNLKTFLKEAIGGSRAKTAHLDGSFYYPDHGIGEIIDKIADTCGRPSIRTDSRITKIFHDGRKINAIEINGQNRVETHHVINTLPLNLFIKMLAPRPAPEILSLADSLRFRHVLLVALFLNKAPFTGAATIYFPDPEYIFTRLYEPANRSPRMAPPGKTSLVVEIPCQFEDGLWDADEEQLIQQVCDTLLRIGWFKKEELLGAEVRRMFYAYPILEKGFEEKVARLFHYLDGFGNLASSGRGGYFRYIHLHDMLRSGKEIVEQYQHASRQ